MPLVPITAAMLALANPNAAKPTYSGPGVAGDWSGGAVGNDVNAAAANVSLASSAATAVANVAPYAPVTQTDKGNLMVPNRNVLADIGKDYGPYAGSTGRTGTIGPRDPYPMQAGHQ
jgi:hypothetical protein